MSGAEIAFETMELASKPVQSSIERVLDLPRAIIESLPIGVYVCNLDGLVLGYNRHASDIWGRTPVLGDPSQLYCGSLRTYTPRGEPLGLHLAPMTEVLRTGIPVHDRELMIERPDGSLVHVIVNIEPLRDHDGQFVGAVNCMLDITDRKKAEQATRERDQWYRDLLQALPVAIYTTDEKGRITFYNQAAVEFSGREPIIGTDEWCVSGKLYWPDGTPMPHDQCPMAVALRENLPIRGAEGVAERPDGSRVPFIPYPTPLHDSTGKTVGAVNMLVDITDRKRAELAQQLLVSIIESSDDAILSKNLYGIITSWNAGAERLFGYTAAEAVGKSITMLIPPDRIDEEPGIIARIRRGEHVDHYETTRVRKDGGLVEISLTVSPIKDGTGRIVGASKIARDVTERKRAEKRLELLTQELDHRAKNILAVMQAMVTVTRANSVNEFATVILGRIKSLSLAHSLLSESRWCGADLKRLVADELAPYGKEQDRVEISGPSVMLAPSGAQAIAMALHELATNAVKYGALAVPTGRVSVLWSRGADGRLALRWRETGGPATRPPSYRGVGMGVIERSVRDQLGGQATFHWHGEGLLCEIDAPSETLTGL